MSQNLDKVLFRIGRVKRIDHPYFSVAGEIARHPAERDDSILAAFQVAAMALGVSAPSISQSLMQGCRGSALNDANRRQLCEGAAAALVSRSDTFLVMRIGIGMGRRLGWPPTSDDETRGLLLAGEDAISTGVGGPDTVSCHGINKVLKSFDRLDEIGEVGYAREMLKQSGRTQAEYTQKAQKTRLRAEAEESTRRQAQAASAARLSPSAATSSKPN